MGIIVTLKEPDIREKALKHGMSFPEDEELVMMILGSGIKGLPIEQLSIKIVEMIKNSNSEDLVKKLMKIKGVGQSKALAIASALELGRRHSNHLRAPIRTPSDVVPFLLKYAVSTQEHLLMVTLNGSHEIINIHVVSVGTLNKTIIHPREIFGLAIKDNAAAIIVCHNHPSGNCSPSEEDIESTEVILSASQIIGIQLLDHLIIDRASYFSFMEHHILFTDED